MVVGEITVCCVLIMLRRMGVERVCATLGIGLIQQQATAFYVTSLATLAQMLPVAVLVMRMPLLLEPSAPAIPIIIPTQLLTSALVATSTASPVQDLIPQIASYALVRHKIRVEHVYVMTDIIRIQTQITAYYAVVNVLHAKAEPPQTAKLVHLMEL
jgi:hypothetical protein